MYATYAAHAASIMVAAPAGLNADQIIIGVAIDNERKTAAVVASVICNDYSTVYVVAAEHLATDDTDAIGKAFATVGTAVTAKYGEVSLGYCAEDAEFLVRCLRSAAESEGLGCSVRCISDDDPQTRSMLTARLISQKRLQIVEDAYPLAQAIAAATYGKNGERDSTSDGVVIEAFEYTVRRYSTWLITAE